MTRAAPRSTRWLVVLGLAFGLGVPGCTSPNPDYPDMFSCNPGDRQCGTPTDRPVALVCGRDAADNLTIVQESCPIGTSCDSGRCVAPPGAATCQRQSDCPRNQSCVPLLTTAKGSIATFCVASQPGAAGGSACTQDSDCQTYHCLQHLQGRFCLSACSNDLQCQLPARCQTLNVTVTGVQGMVGSCGPP